ncbi:MAG TPA: M50 family metallopeptidase [Chloroflexia bacterium]|nr:M50 family metallopeptidase [Chloroflexia bacterium]
MFGGGGPGLRLMRFKGVDVVLDFSVLLLMALFILPQAQSFPRQFPDWSTTEVWSAALLIGAFFVGSILVHELSHAWIGILLGAKVGGIRLFIFGGATYFTSKPSSEARNFWISAAGPIANFALWYLFKLGYEASAYDTVWAVTCYYLSLANLFLGIFNALPGYPMDGGQALRSALIWLTKRELLASKVVMVVGCLTGGLIAFWTIQNVRQGNTLNLLFGGLIAFWVVSGSIAQYREAQRFQPQQPKRPDSPQTTATQAQAPVGIPVGAVMSQPPMAYAPETPVDQFLHHSQNLPLDEKAWLPVLREGYLNGIINRKAARRVSSTEQNVTPIEKVMVPRRNLVVVNADQDISQAYDALRSSQGFPVAVLGAGGLFAGFLTAENLRR